MCYIETGSTAKIVNAKQIAFNKPQIYIFNLNSFLSSVGNFQTFEMEVVCFATRLLIFLTKFKTHPESSSRRIKQSDTA